MPNCVSGNWYEYWVRPEVHSLFEVNQLKRFIAKSQLYPCWSSFWRSLANYFSCCCAWTRKLHLALFMWNCCVMDSFSGYRFTVIFLSVFWLSNDPLPFWRSACIFSASLHLISGSISLFFFPNYSALWSTTMKHAHVFSFIPFSDFNTNLNY
jgi:hypothetical protein